MQRVSDGYTIIEVMIFLGISAVIMGAAMNLISGKQSETDFNQKMRDTQSKIQDWINDVSTGFTGGDPAQQTCYAPGNSRPSVLNVPPTSTYNPQCTFLGKAIQFTDKGNSGVQSGQSSLIYSYSVFGRLYMVGAGQQLPTNMAQALPDSAVGKAGGGSSQADLTDIFSLNPVYIKSVCGIAQGTSTCGPSHMIGFMNSFNTEQNTLSNGSDDLSAYLYNYNGNSPPANAAGGNPVIKCIQGVSTSGNNCIFAASPPNPPNPPSLKSFTICLSDNRRTAEIVITSPTGIGVSTQLEYVAC